MADLKDFLSELAIDPTKLGQFIHDPDAAMQSAKLSDADKAALRSGFASVIYARLAGLPIEQAFQVLIRPPVGVPPAQFGAQPAQWPPAQFGAQPAQWPPAQFGAQPAQWPPAQFWAQPAQWQPAQFWAPPAQWPPAQFWAPPAQWPPAQFWAQPAQWPPAQFWGWR